MLNKKQLDDFLNLQGRSWLDIAVSPSRPVAEASKFSDWVFNSSMYKHLLVKSESERDEENSERMKEGRWDHARINYFFASAWAKVVLRGSSTKDWSLFYSDPHDDRPTRVFYASKLLVNNKKIGCKPDAVFVHKSGKIYLIVERKTSWVPCHKIPPVGWPNIQAQLWCYSWIDEWQGAEEVILVGEIWKRIGKPDASGFEVCEIKPTWFRSNQEHNIKCEEWFRKYGGTVAI